MHSHMTNTRLTDPEVLEFRYPVTLTEFSIRRGTGGKGRHRGGDGIRRAIRFEEEMEAQILSNHRTVPTFGLEVRGSVDNPSVRSLWFGLACRRRRCCVRSPDVCSQPCMCARLARVDPDPVVGCCGRPVVVVL